MLRNIIIYAFTILAFFFTAWLFPVSADGTVATKDEMCGNYPCSSLPGIGDTCCPWSDLQLKDNILPLRDALRNLMKLQGVSYTWKQNGSEDIGLIAQQVEAVWPEAVRDQGILKTVDYYKLVAPMIESIKEQQRQIEALQSELNQIKAMLLGLSSSLPSMQLQAFMEEGEEF